ncbi:MAG: transglycosylase SLT domain-containing protein [Deltaproteobacteria bacterium]|nr:transglycosylase SLT domain-containing protein [Deltaproteobacteria bacterium]
MKHSARWLAVFLLSLLLCSAAELHAQGKPAGENQLPLLPGLENAVEFWKRVFTEYSSSQLVFFDPLDMSRIYEVQDVGEDSRPKRYISGEIARIAAAHGVDSDRVKSQRGIKERTAAGIKRSGKYLAQMQQIFRERGLPAEIAYLPIVESSYDINARSNVGALGMWQFMRVTGKQFNMRVDRNVDERKDPVESTRAAAAYLQQAYESLGSWPLAITSYNYGPAGMARAVSEIGSNDLVTLIQKYHHRYWGFAPKNFYAEFLAAVEIGKNPNKYFPELEIDPPLAIEEAEVTKNTTVAALASSKGLTRQQLLEWNPALSHASATVPAGYRVKLPAGGKAEIVVAEATPSRPQAKAKRQVVHHRVKRGETLIHIAQRYGASLERILKANGLRRTSLLKVGSTLLIPRA